MTFEEQMRITAAEAQGWTGPWRFGNEHLHGTPPNANQSPAGLNDIHVPEKIDNSIKDLCQQIRRLSHGIDAVRALMNESVGVSGLYKNGDIVLWGELEEKGRFWEWLVEFNDAERVLSALRRQKKETNKELRP